MESIKRFGITLEVAKTDEDKLRGYQYRKQGPALNEGMLFVFDIPQAVSFHMRNVSFPLQIMFLDEKWNVINQDQMAPELGMASCDKPVKYAIECNKDFKLVDAQDYVNELRAEWDEREYSMDKEYTKAQLVQININLDKIKETTEDINLLKDIIDVQDILAPILPQEETILPEPFPIPLDDTEGVPPLIPEPEEKDPERIEIIPEEMGEPQVPVLIEPKEHIKQPPKYKLVPYINNQIKRRIVEECTSNYVSASNLLNEIKGIYGQESSNWEHSFPRTVLSEDETVKIEINQKTIAFFHNDQPIFVAKTPNEVSIFVKEATSEYPNAYLKLTESIYSKVMSDLKVNKNIDPHIFRKSLIVSFEDEKLDRPVLKECLSSQKYVSLAQFEKEL